MLPSLVPRFFLALLLACLAGHAALADDKLSRPWTERLEADLARIDAANAARIGVYVRDMDTGVSASYKAGDRWYLASTVKVPVAVAVLRGIDRGLFTLDTAMTLRASDYVDGAGGTNKHPVGASLTLRYLMEQMIIFSDNTASDMLIHLVGLDAVNDVVQGAVPQGFNRITSLADVRRAAYGYLTPAASQLVGRDLLLIHQQKSDAERLMVLSHLTGTPTSQFRATSLEAAFRQYYASGLNAGRLDAYGEFLAQLADGRLMSPGSTAYLLGLMHRTATGAQRIKAGLPPDARFAHKTGTQRRRSCDSGVISVPRPGANTPPQRVLVAACTAGELSTERSDLALRQVGAALCNSGLLTQGVTDAPFCHVPPSPTRAPVSPRR